jgi:predicted  nucleic acid-binding Zn-ribbon protein
MTELEIFLRLEDKERRPSIVKKRVEDEYLLTFSEINANERYVAGRWRRQQIRYHLDHKHGVLHALEISPLPQPVSASSNLCFNSEGIKLDVAGGCYNLPGLCVSSWTPKPVDFSYLIDRSRNELATFESKQGSSGFNFKVVENACDSKCHHLKAEIFRLQQELVELNRDIATTEDRLQDAKEYLNQLERAVRDAQNLKKKAVRYQNNLLNIIEDSKNDIDRANSEISKLRKKSYETKADLEVTESKIRNRKQNINKLEQKISDARSGYNEAIQIQRQAESDEEDAQSRIPDAKREIRTLEKILSSQIVERDAKQNEMDHDQWLFDNHREVKKQAVLVDTLLSDVMPFRPARNAKTHMQYYARAISKFNKNFNDAGIGKAGKDLEEAIGSLTDTVKLCRHHISVCKSFLDYAVSHLVKYEAQHLNYASQPLHDVYAWMAAVAERYADGLFLDAVKILGEDGIPDSADEIASSSILSAISSWSNQAASPDRKLMFYWSQKPHERGSNSLLTLIRSLTSFAVVFDEDLRRIQAAIRELYTQQRTSIDLLCKSRLSDDGTWEGHLNKIRSQLYLKENRAGLEEPDASYIVWYLGHDKFNALLISLKKTIDTLNKAIATISSDNLEAYNILCLNRPSAESLITDTVSLDTDFWESGNNVYNRLVTSASRAREVKQHRQYIFQLLSRYAKDPAAPKFLGFNKVDLHHELSTSFSEVVQPETRELETEVLMKQEVGARKERIQKVDHSLVKVADPFDLNSTRLPEQAYDFFLTTNIEEWGRGEILFAWSEEMTELQFTYEYLWAYDRLAEKLGNHDRQEEICRKLDILESRYSNYTEHREKLEKHIPKRWNHWLEFQEQLNESLKNGIELFSDEEILKDFLRYGHDIAEWIVQCYRAALEKYRLALDKQKERSLLEGEIVKAKEDGTLLVINSGSNSDEADRLVCEAKLILDKVKFRESSEEKIHLPIVPGDKRSFLLLDRDLGYSLIDIIRQRKQMAKEAEERIRALFSLLKRFGDGENRIPFHDFLRVMTHEEGFRRRMQLFSIPVDLAIREPEHVPKTPEVFSLPADKMWEKIIETMNERDQALPRFARLLLLEASEDKDNKSEEIKEDQRTDAEQKQLEKYLDTAINGTMDAETGMIRSDSDLIGLEFIKPARDLVHQPTEEIFLSEYYIPICKSFSSSMAGLANFLRNKYNEAITLYSMSGMTSWYSQRIIYTLNRLLEDPVAPEYALKDTGWVYEGTIVPINPFMAFFQNKYEEIVEYIEKYKTGELEELKHEVSKWENKLDDSVPREQHSIILALLNRLKDSTQLHQKILTEYPKPQAHFDFLTQSINAMKRELENWEEIVNRAIGTLNTKKLPFLRIERFLKEGNLPGKILGGKDGTETLDESEKALQREFLKSGAYPYIYGLSTTQDIDVQFKLVFTGREYDVNMEWELLLFTPEQPRHRGMVMVVVDNEPCLFYPFTLMKMVKDQIFQLAKEDLSKKKEYAIWLDKVQDSLDRALKTPSISLLLDI